MQRVQLEESASFCRYDVLRDVNRAQRSTRGRTWSISGSSVNPQCHILAWRVLRLLPLPAPTTNHPSPAFSTHVPSLRTSMSRFTTNSSKPAQSVRSSDSSPALPNSGSLAQRLLSPNPSTPLPPIITPDPVSPGPPELPPDVTTLNDQLYFFLALTFRAFVLPWWSKISPRDKDFLPQLTVISRAVIQEVHRRLRRADLASLLVIQLPILIRQHYVDYKQAEAKLGTSFSTTPTASLDDIFHRLQPHIALDRQDETAPLIDQMYLRTVVDLVVKASLPPEDSNSDMERTIVREIVVGPVLGNAIPKLIQPWFIHRIALDLLGPPKSAKENPPSSSRPSLTFNTLVILFLTAVQTVSTVCLNLIHASQDFYQLVQTVNSNPSPKNSSAPSPTQGLFRPALSAAQEVLDLHSPDNCTNPAGKALLNTVEILSGLSEPFLDRLIPHLLKTHVFTAPTVSKVLVASTRNLFPESNNHYPGPPPVVPSEEEQRVLRETLEARLREAVPFPLSGPLTAARILDPLSSAACNAHLLVVVIDLLVVTLFPELGLGNAPEADTWGLDSDTEVGDAVNGRGYNTSSDSSRVDSP